MFPASSAQQKKNRIKMRYSFIVKSIAKYEKTCICTCKKVGK